jgi:hypothetical protein
MRFVNTQLRKASERAVRAGQTHQHHDKRIEVVLNDDVQLVKILYGARGSGLFVAS